MYQSDRNHQSSYLRYWLIKRSLIFFLLEQKHQLLALLAVLLLFHQQLLYPLHPCPLLLILHSFCLFFSLLFLYRLLSLLLFFWLLLFFLLFLFLFAFVGLRQWRLLWGILELGVFVHVERQEPRVGDLLVFLILVL